MGVVEMKRGGGHVGGPMRRHTGGVWSVAEVVAGSRGGRSVGLERWCRGRLCASSPARDVIFKQGSRVNVETLFKHLY